MRHAVVASHIDPSFFQFKITLFSDGSCKIYQFVEGKVNQEIEIWRWEWGEGKRYLRLVTKPIDSKSIFYYFSLHESEVSEEFSQFLSDKLQTFFKGEFGYKEWRI